MKHLRRRLPSVASVSPRPLAPRCPSLLTGASIAACLLAFVPASRAVDGVWTNPVTGGLWSDTANWSGAVVADGIDALANFSTIDILGDNLVHLDTPRTIGNVTFGDVTVGTAGGWMIDDNGDAANNILTLAVSAGTPTITVNALGTGKTATIQAGIAGVNGLTKAGAGTLMLSGTNTYTGGTMVNAGALVFGSAASVGGTGANVTVNSGGTVGLGTGLDQALLSRISGASTGSVALIGNNANALDFSAGGGGGGLGVVSLGSTGAFSYTGALTPTADGIYRLGGGGGTLTVPNVNALTGLRSLFVTLGGFLGSKVALTAANDFSGGTTLASGTLAFSALNNLGSGGLNFTGGTLQWAAANTADISTGVVNLDTGGGTLDLGANNVTLSNPIGNNGLGGLTKTGAGTLTLNGANTYSGGTFLNAGSTFINADAALGAASGGVTFTGTSTLQLGPGVTLGAGRTLTFNNGVTATVDTQTNANTVSSALAGAGALTKIGAAQLTYNGTGTYTGGLNVNVGVFRVGAGASLTSGRLSTAAVSGVQFYVNGGTYTSTATALSTISQTGLGFLIDSGSATFNGVGGGIQTANSDGAVIKVTGGTLTASDINVQRSSNPVSFTSGFIVTAGTVNAGTIRIGTNNSTGAMSIQGGDVTATGAVTIGNQSTGNSNRGGGMQVTGGTFTVTDPTSGLILAKTNGSNPINVATAAFSGGVSTLSKLTLGFDSTVTGGSATVTLSGTGLLYIGAGGIVKNGTSGFTTAVNLNGGTLGAAADWASAVGVSMGTTAASNMAIKAADAANVPHNITFNSALTGSGGFAVSGGGTVILGANNPAYTGGTPGTTISAGSTLQVGNAGTAGTLGTSAVANGGTLAFNRTDTVTIANAISGAGELKQIGTGTTVLTGALTYAGNTTINAGTLRLNSSLATPVIVNPGGALGGVGPVAGLVTVNSGGKIAPSDTTGAAPGTLTVGNLSLSSGSTLDFDFSTPSTFDKVLVSNTDGLTSDGAGLNLFSVGTTNPWLVTGDYKLFQYSGNLGGLAATNLNSAFTILNPDAGLLYNFAASGGFVTLSITSPVIIPTWNVTTGGSWASAGNWNTTVPNAVDATAVFGSKITAPSTVTLDGNKTVGTLQLNNAANAYTIAQGTSGTLFLSKTTGSAAIDDVSGSHTISAPLSLTSSTVATVFDAADTLTLNNVGGAGALTKAGAGTMVLAGPNSYGGGTAINAGILQIKDNLSLGAAPLVFTGAGKLQAGADNLAPLNNIVIGSAVTATVDTQANTLTIGGTISDTAADGGLTKSGTGKLILTASNTYGGATTVNGGVLSVATLANGGLASPIGQSTNASTNLVLDGGTLEYTGADASTNRLFTVGTGGGQISVVGAGALTFNNAGALTFSGTNAARTLTLSGSNAGPNTLAATIGNNGTGATSLVKAGSNNWILSGTNTFTGQTVISGGFLTLANASALAGSTLNYDNQGGTLDLGALTTLTLGGLTGAQSLVLTNNAAAAIALTVGGNGSDTTYAGNLTGGTTLAKNGTGTLKLTGTNVFTGATTINGGTLEVGTGGSLTTTSIAPTVSNAPFHQTGGTVTAGTLNLQTGSSLQLKATIDGGTATFTTTQLGATGATSSPCLLTINGGTVGLGAYTSLRDGSGSFNTTSGLLITGGTVTATSVKISTNASWSNINLQGGSLEIGSTASTGAFSLSTGTAAGRGGNLTMTGGSLTYAGTDGLLLNAAAAGSNTRTDQAIFSGGTANLTGVVLNATTATGGTSTMTINGGAVYLGTVGIQANTAAGATAVVNLSSGTLGASADWTSSAALNLVGTSATTLTVRAADANDAPHNITLSGAISATPTVGNTIATNLAKSGAGLLTLSGASNTYTGATNVNAGTLVVAGAISGTSAVNVASGAVVQLGLADVINNAAPLALNGGTLATQGFSETVGVLSLAGTSSLDLGLGASILHFADSSLTPWTGTLSITNWSGFASGGGTDQLFFGVNDAGLSSGQVALVQFINPDGFDPGSYGAIMLSTGELVAVVPEPGTLLSLLGGTGVLLGLRRRRRA